MHSYTHALITFLLLLSCTSPEAKKTTSTTTPPDYVVPAQLGLMHEMQGRWKDGLIEGAELRIQGNRFISLYQNEIKVDATFEVFDKCPTICPQGKGIQGKGFFIVHRKDGDFCYVLQELSDEGIEYAPLGRVGS